MFPGPKGLKIQGSDTKRINVRGPHLPQNRWGVTWFVKLAEKMRASEEQEKEPGGLAEAKQLGSYLLCLLTGYAMN